MSRNEGIVWTLWIAAGRGGRVHKRRKRNIKAQGEDRKEAERLVFTKVYKYLGTTSVQTFCADRLFAKWVSHDNQDNS